MDFSNDKLIELPRPELGRPTDPRLTAEYIAARPELERAGYPAFDPQRDIDYHGYIESALQWLHAQVQYADPALHGELTQTLAEAQKTLADTAQSTETLMQAAGVGRVASEADLAGQPAGVYELTGSNERLTWDGTNIVPGSRGPSLAPAQTTTVTAIARNPGDIQGAALRALDVGAGEIPADADWTLTERLVIDCQGRRFNFVNRGRLHFDVRDANGGAMIQVINPAPGSEIDLGYWDHVGIPMPSYLIMRGEEHLAATPEEIASTPPVPAEYGPAFVREDQSARLHWRTHSDHGVEIVNAVGCTITVNLGSARAMGVIFNGGHDNHVYGSISNTLADGTHQHNGSYNIHWHGVRVTNAGDDAFPVVPKPDEPLPHNIYYWGCQAQGGFGRGFIQAGGVRVFWDACFARDTLKEGFLVIEDAYYQTGTPSQNYATDCTAERCGQRDTSQTGEQQPGGFRVGYQRNLGETEIHWTRCRSIDNRGSGFWTAGKGVKLTDCQSVGNGVEDVFYSTDLTIQGGEFQQSKIDTAYFRVFALPRWRKRGSSTGYALKIVGDNPGRIEADFGSEWGMYPLATAGALTQVDLRGSIGVGHRMLPNRDYYGITPALPESGAGFITNNTPFDVLVLIQGGDVLGINLKSPDGIEVAVGSQRMVMLPRGWAINSYWTAATPEKWFWGAP